MRQNVTMRRLMRWQWLPAALGGIAMGSAAVGVCLALAPAPAEDAGEARPVVGEVRIVVQQALWPAACARLTRLACCAGVIGPTWEATR